ncbi:MAG: CBS and ACT domain-containing protein [Bacillota bacterium]
MFIKDHMTPNPITIPSNTPILEALDIMKKQKIRQLPVVDKGVLTGLVTRYDLLTVSPSPATTLSVFEMNYLLSRMVVKEVMIKNPPTISPEANIEEAAVIMREHKIGSLLVVENNKLVGIITESDLFEALIKLFGFRRAGTRIVIETENRVGALADMLDVVRDHNISVIGIACVERPEQKVQVVLRLNTTEPGPLVEEFKNKGFDVRSIS